MKKYQISEGFIVYVNKEMKTITIEKGGNRKCSHYSEMYEFNQTLKLLSTAFCVDFN